MTRVSPNWMNEKRKEVAEGRFSFEVISYNPAAQWLIAFLARQDIPCNVVNLGAGVQRITVAEKVCPHCGGKGYLK